MNHVWADLRKYGHFAARLREALRHPITPEDARAIVRRRMAERETNFLRMVEGAVFQNPRSPYLPLLARAGCGLGDLQDMVRARGLERTLEALRAAGVYVTLEEFKGRSTAIVRGAQVTPVRSHDFDNPGTATEFHGQSGGTTGPGVKVGLSVDNMVAQSPNLLLAYEAHGLLGVPIAQWRGMLPNTAAINNMFRGGALIGHVHAKWFSPSPAEWRLRRLNPRLLTWFIIGVGRLAGARLPWPQQVGFDRAIVVARWVAETVAAHGGAHLRCTASMALRVSVAARGRGIGLAGATMVVGGEPVTPAKAAEIRRSGARCIPAYSCAEAGAIGYGCAGPVGVDDVHVFKDLHAVIQAPRQIAGSWATIPAFYFTTLHPGAPKILLNAEIGDYGIFESRPCGCALEGHGFTDHLREIRSFGLLTTEGTMLLASDMVRVLEEVLPARFGGSPLDYQMVEEEDGDGFTRLNLLVHPRIHIANEEEVVRTVFEHLGRSNRVNRSLWTEAGTMRVKRMEPAASASQKFIPLQFARRPGRPGPPTSSPGAV